MSEQSTLEDSLQSVESNHLEDMRTKNRIYLSRIGNSIGKITMTEDIFEDLIIRLNKLIDIY